MTFSEVVPLAFVSDGRVVEVVDVRAGRGLARRLMELGIAPRARLRVVKGVGGGPAVVEVLSSTGGSMVSSQRVVLGFGVACKVMVRVVGWTAP